MKDYEQIATQMGFRSNTTLLEVYIEVMANLLCQDRAAILDKITETLGVLGDKPFARYFMLPCEIFLYTLPIVKAARDDPNALVAFNGQSVEPFYKTFQCWVDLLMPDREPAAYLHIDRHVNIEQAPLLPRSILPLLTVEEAQDEIDEAEWDAIERAAAGFKPELDEHIQRMRLADSLEGLRQRRASRGELICAIADFGLDKRFRYLYNMAQHSRFGDYCKSEDLNVAKSGVPIDRVIAWMRDHNNSLEYPLDSDDMVLLEAGIRQLGGSQRRVYGFERSGLHKYMITFGDIRRASVLKNLMDHGARPILNLLLGQTSFGEQMTDASGRPRRILYIDQTMTSGVSFLVWELVFRAFHGNVAGLFITIAQHTADSITIVKRHNFIDNISAVGIWPQENNLEYYDGLFLDIDGSGVRYRTFSELLDYLDDKQGECGAPIGGDLDDQLVALNRDIETFIRSCSDHFDFVDSVSSLRFDREVIKRQMIKMLLRPGDHLEAVFLKKYYMLGAGMFEEDFIGSYLLSDGMKRLNTPEFLSSIPQDLKDRDRRLRSFDQHNLIQQLQQRARDRGQQRAELRHRLMSSAGFEEVVQGYLGERVSFEEVERVFYDQYAPLPGSCAW